LHIFSAGARIRALAGIAEATIDIASAIRKTRMMFSFQATQFPPASAVFVQSDSLWTPNPSRLCDEVKPGQIFISPRMLMKV
jgi:hypothetical protein